LCLIFYIFQSNNQIPCYFQGIHSFRLTKLIGYWNGQFLQNWTWRRKPSKIPNDFVQFWRSLRTKTRRTAGLLLSYFPILNIPCEQKFSMTPYFIRRERNQKDNYLQFFTNSWFGYVLPLLTKPMLICPLFFYPPGPRT